MLADLHHIHTFQKNDQLTPPPPLTKKFVGLTLVAVCIVNGVCLPNTKLYTNCPLNCLPFLPFLENYSYNNVLCSHLMMYVSVAHKIIQIIQLFTCYNHSHVHL